jgi:hypothetical protein
MLPPETGVALLRRYATTQRPVPWTSWQDRIRAWISHYNHERNTPMRHDLECFDALPDAEQRRIVHVLAALREHIGDELDYVHSIGFCIFPIPEVPVTQG